MISQIPETNTKPVANQTVRPRIVKVNREVNFEKKEYECFEFMNIGDTIQGFNLLATNLKDLPIWNIEKFFEYNIRAFLL